MSEVTRKDREAGWLAYVSVSGGAAGIPDWAERWLEHGDPEPSTSLLRAFAQAIADAREEGRAAGYEAGYRDGKSASTIGC